MHVKKFEAASLDEALYLVKSELGPNALILSTQQKKKPWFNRATIEVTAAFETPKESPPRLEQIFDENSLAEIFPHRRNNIDNTAVSRESRTAPKPGRYVDIPGPKPRKHETTRIEDRFVDLGISVELSKDLASQIVFEYPQKDLSVSSFLDKAMVRMLSSRFSCAPVDTLLSPGSWVPIGLSGSGKTSVLVKLALSARAKSRSVSLVSLDRMRLMSRETLAGYARLIQVPFYSEKTLGRSRELIKFIDCPSLPLGGTDTEWELFEKTVSAKKTFVVLDATTRLKEAERFLEQVVRFSPVGICFTKIDLVSQLGPMFELLRTSKFPLVGVSMAQAFKVPFRFLDEKEFGLLVIKHGVFE